MGGNVFEETVPLKSEHIQDFYTELSKHIPDLIKMRVVGSSNLVKEEYNDLDFVFEADNMQWAAFVRFLTDMFVTKKITSQCYSVCVYSPYTDNWHQVDFMQSKDITYSVDVYHSSKTSKYKSAHRNILIMSMIKTLTAKEFNLGNDRYIRTRKHLDLFEGLVYLVQKKTKTAQRYTTIDRLPLSFNFLEIVKQFLPNVTMAKLDSFETLHEEIFRHFYREKDDRKTYLAILKETTETLTSAKLDIPMEIKYWIEVPDFV